MIEEKRDPLFARIYKTWAQGRYSFQGFSAKTQEEYDASVGLIEKLDYFRGWATEVEDASTMDYEFTMKVRNLNDEEAARPKTAIEQLELSMYHVQRALGTAEASVITLRTAHAVAMQMLEQHKKETGATINAQQVEINNLRMELGMPPVEGWDEWAKHQVPVDPALDKKIDEALFGPGGREAWKAKNGR